MMGDELIFLRMLREMRHIGYGRMMNIISKVWYMEMKEKYGNGVGVFMPVCITLEDVEEVEASIKYDPLFQEE